VTVKDKEGGKDDGKVVRRVIEGMNMIKVHYMHAWKCHNESPYFVRFKKMYKITDKNSVLHFMRIIIHTINIGNFGKHVEK
jgi:hypothetical protein